MPFVRLKVFLIISFSLHIVALLIATAFFHPEWVITKPSLIVVGVTSESKNHGVGSGNSMEQLAKEPPKLEKSVESPSNKVSKPGKKVVKRFVNDNQETPEKKAMVNMTNEPLADQFVTQPSQSSAGGGNETNESASTLTGIGYSEGGKGVSTQGSRGGGEQVGYPDYKVNPKPRYPMIARRSGYEGVVLLRVWVIEDGKVGKIKLENSSGYEVLDKSAIEAVKDWIFIPAKKNGVSISSWVTVPIRFELSSG